MSDKEKKKLNPKVIIFTVLVVLGLALVFGNLDNDDTPDTSTPMMSSAPVSSQQADEPETLTKENEKSEYSILDSFVTQYNSNAQSIIKDRTKININDKSSPYYRVEFRLGPFQDAPSQTANIENGHIEMVNYGYDRSEFRIYITTNSYEEIQTILETAAPILEKDIKAEEIQEVYEDIDFIENGVSFTLGDTLSGFYDKEYDNSEFRLMLNCENVDFAQ